MIVILNGGEAGGRDLTSTYRFDGVDGNVRGAGSALSLRDCFADGCALSGPSEGLRPPWDDKAFKELVHIKIIDWDSGESTREMKLKLPAGAFGAYLFDCDGTIADSMPLHYKAWKKALGEWHCEFDEKLFYSWGGMPVAEIISTLNQQNGLNMPVDDVSRRKEELYYELLPQLRAVPEVLEHVEEAYGRIPFAVVSGSTRESVTASLISLKLLDRFETLVCAGEYKKSKPDPEAFLMAAAKLGVAPGTCLVFEDTEMGIQAAKAAGMASVKVPPPWERGNSS